MTTGDEVSDEDVEAFSDLETGAILDFKVHKEIICAFTKEIQEDASKVPPYSSDLAGCINTVVELMCQRGYSFSLTKVCYVSSVSWGWEARFVRDVYPPKASPEGYQGIGWQCENPATAVCIAALRVVDLEKKEIVASVEATDGDSAKGKD